MHYTENTTEEYKQMHKALTIAEKILDHINESIRDQEGREVLRVISQHLWIGQGYSIMSSSPLLVTDNSAI